MTRRLSYSQSLAAATKRRTQGAILTEYKKPLFNRGASYVKALVFGSSIFQGTSRTPFVFTQDGGSGFLQDAGLAAIQRKWKKEVD